MPNAPIQKIKLGTASGDEQFERIFDEAFTVGREAAGEVRGLWPVEYRPGYNGQTLYQAACKFVFEVAKTYHEQKGVATSIPDKLYLRHFCWHWLDTREKGEPLVVWKTRRILISWVCRVLELYMLGLKVGKHLLSDETYSKSCGHVWRYSYIFDQVRRQPQFALLTPGTVYGSPANHQLDSFSLPNGSIFTSINSDVQSFQGDGVLSISTEELPTYQHIDKVWAQALTLVKAGGGDVINGHVVGIGNTELKSEWLRLKKRGQTIWVRDEANGEPELPNGVEVWISEGGCRVLKIPFCADPDKADPAWEAKERQGYDEREWQKLFGMVEESSAGLPVFEDFVRAEHCPPIWRETSYSYSDRFSHYIFSGDIGTSLNPAGVLWEIKSGPIERAEVIMLREFVPMDHKHEQTKMESIDFMENVVSEIQNMLPYAWPDVEYVADKDVLTRSSIGFHNLLTVVKDRLGIRIRPIPNLWPLRYATMRDLLSDFIVRGEGEDEEEVRRLTICEKDCPWLVSGLNGAYVYAEPRSGETEGRTLKPATSKYTHVQDAAQFGALAIVDHFTTRAKILKRNGLSDGEPDSIWNLIKKRA